MSERVVLLPPGHSRPIGRYSPGLAVVPQAGGRFVFVSGQVATDHQGRVLAPGNPGTQAEIVFERIESVLAQAGGSLADLVSVVVYLVDRAHFEAVSAVRNRVLSEPAPSSTLIVAARLAEEGCLVEISGIALVSGARREATS
jgi:2-iminobutanoate/2-iminopropanoate deaminase